MNQKLIDNNYIIIPNFISSYKVNKLKDSFMRHIYSEISNLGNYLEQQNIPIHTSDCIGATKDPLFSIDSLKNEILRKYSL